jgi:hypothetical protein
METDPADRRNLSAVAPNRLQPALNCAPGPQGSVQGGPVQGRVTVTKEDGKADRSGPPQLDGLKEDGMTRSKWLLAMLMSLGSMPLLAWDGAFTGTIYAMDVTSGHSYGVRVFLSGVPNMCGTGSNWAYLNDTDSNYNTYVAALMMAKAQGSPVTIYTTRENNYCHIGYISVNS